MCALTVLGKMMDFLGSCTGIFGPFLFLSFDFFFFLKKQVRHMLESVPVLGYTLRELVGFGKDF